MRRALRIFRGRFICTVLTVFPFGAVVSMLGLNSYFAAHCDFGLLHERIPDQCQPLVIVLPSLPCHMVEKPALKLKPRPARRTAREHDTMLSLRTFLRPLYIRLGALRRLWRVAQHLKFLLQKAGSTLGSGRHDLAAINSMAKERFGPLPRLRDTPDTLPEIDIVVEATTAHTLRDQLQAVTDQAYPLARLHLFIPIATVAMRAEALRFQDAFANLNLLEQDATNAWGSLDHAIRAGHTSYCLILRDGSHLEYGALLALASGAVADADSASWEPRCRPQEQRKYYDPVTLETVWSDHRCILLRRSAYEHAGGYELCLQIGRADIELSYRLRSLGYRLRYLPWTTYYFEAPPQRAAQDIEDHLGGLCIQLRYGDAWARCMAFGQLLVQRFAVQLRGPKTAAEAEQSRQTLQQIPHLLRDKGAHPVAFPMSKHWQSMLREPIRAARLSSLSATNTPLVSVIVRSYQGRETLLRQALQSVINQTYPRVELLVIQDGGDSLANLVDEMVSGAMQPIEVRFIANAKLGRSAAGNCGLAMARGQFLMFLDDDDLFFANHIETLVTPLLAENSLAATYSLAFEVLTDMSPDMHSYVEVLYQLPKLFYQKWDYKVLLDHNFIAIQSILFRRELYDARGGFDTKLDQLEDWNLWLRYGYNNLFLFVPSKTSLFRSPANYKIRTQRQSNLNKAYEAAKARAQSAIMKIQCDLL